MDIAVPWSGQLVIGQTAEVELEARRGAIVISPVNGVRSGWEEAAQNLHERGDDQLVDRSVNTMFDDEEWEW